MNKKVLAFIFDGKNFLLLRNNPADPAHGGDYWFTVTGSLEEGESKEDALKREVKEETDLTISKILDLKWSSIYSWGGKDNVESNFLVFVKHKEVKLSEEHIDFEWLNLDNYIRRIKWDLNKEELKKVLKEAIKGKVFFEEEKIDDFRKIE